MIVQKTYKIGDVCLYNSLPYKCIVAITVPEAFTAAHWNLLNNSPAFTDGCVYFTPNDNGFYIDATYVDPTSGNTVNKRIKVNSWEDVTLSGNTKAETVKTVGGQINVDDSSQRIATTEWVNALLTKMLDD